MTALLFESSPWLIPLLMLIALSLCIELPFRLRTWLADKSASKDSVNAVIAALLTLAAFVLGLSFSQASARFDSRRAVVVAEANAIGTTWLRADQLEAPDRTRFRTILTNDTAARIAAYQRSYHSDSYRQIAAQADRDQAELWDIASSALRPHPTSQGLSLLMQSLNQTIDVIAQQRQLINSHVPAAIVVLTLCLVTLGALSLGIRFALDESRPIFLSAIYVFAYVIVIEMMLDYDRPNSGFVRVSLTPLTLQLESMRRSSGPPSRYRSQSNSPSVRQR